MSIPYLHDPIDAHRRHFLGEDAHDTDDEESISTKNLSSIIDAYRLALFYAPALEQIAIKPISFIAAENAVIDEKLEEGEKTAVVDEKLEEEEKTAVVDIAAAAFAEEDGM